MVQDSRLVPVGQTYRVGLYDATTGTRLPATAPDGSHLADDAVPIVPSRVSPE